MESYKKAAAIASKPDHSGHACEKAFPSCPYGATEMIQMINSIRERQLFEIVEPDNFNNMETTLTAIEKLNNVTLTALRNGLPLPNEMGVYHYCKKIFFLNW